MNILKKLSKDSSGFGHIETILIVLVVAVIAGVGFFVYQNHNKKISHITAHAGSWAVAWGPYNGVTGWDCKAVWGNLEQIRFAYTKSANTPAYTYEMFFNGKTTKSNAYYAGTFGELTTPYFDNRQSFTYGTGPDAPVAMPILGTTNTLPNC